MTMEPSKDADPKPEATAAAPEEKKEESKSKAKEEPKEEKKADSKPDTKEDRAEEKKEAPKTEAKKEDSKSDAKEEPKAGEKKEEPKVEESKPEPKKEHGHHSHSHEHKTEHNAHVHTTEHKSHHSVHHKKEETNYWKIATAILAIAFIITLFSLNMGGPATPDAPIPAAAPAAPANPNAPQLADTSGDAEVTLTIVNDPNCAACDTTSVLGVLTGQLFPNSKVVTVDFDSDEGAALIEKYDLRVLPSYIYDSGVKDNANFNQVAETMIEKDDVFLLNPAATGVGKYLNPPGEDDDPTLGDADAPVTIIEFSDFECPFCKRFYDDAYKKIKEEYVRTGKVKIVYRDFPLGFHPNAQKAAEAGECADDQGQFWPMHDKIFENQNAIGVSDLKGYAEDLKLDTEEFNDCLDSGKHAEEVQADIDDGANGGVSGTPAFFINGELISGAQPFEVFKTAIDAALEE